MLTKMNTGIIFGSFIVLLFGELSLVPIFAAKFESELVLFEPFGKDDNFVLSGRITRLARGVYGLTANISILKDITDEYVGEVQIYRSPLGTNQYSKTSLGAARGELPFDQFMTEFYKPYLMKSVKSCSNLPQFEGNFKPPLKANVYEIKNCQGHDEDIPIFFVEGEYQLEVTLKRTKNRKIITGLRLVFKVTKRVN